MACTKTLVAFIILELLLSACGGAPKKDDKPEEQVVSNAENEAEAPLVLIPNPYLESASSVQGKAKDEFNKALAAMKVGKWQQAEGVLSLMTETWPKLSGTYVNLGICQYKQERLEEAEKSWKTASQNNTYNMDAYTWLGVSYREQGRFKEAEDIYLVALQVWPHNADAHRNLGILYDLYLGRFEEALSHYKMLQKILPEDDRQVKGWILDLERRLSGGA
ncbi:tetratricopeptide repeat protein [Teredinibacter haidensis]|uniref:tetratricopeptide repeat protein n=1 Tax=Teredinibacter haidensis TaxID=2731755 RepID=UPI000948F952|nr:tetratricopeptide repeat protein [Teredinibacter haidensis]